MKFQQFVLLIVLLKKFVCQSISEIKFDIYKTDFDSFGFPILLNSPAKNILTCARLCFKNTQCASGLYKPSSQQCLLYGYAPNKVSVLRDKNATSQRVNYILQKDKAIKDNLYQNEFLYEYGYIESGDFRAVLEPTGAFTIYNTKGFNNQYYKIWSTGSIADVSSRPFKIRLQSDANLLILRNNSNTVWNTGVFKGNFTYPIRLVLRNDGNCMKLDKFGSVLWQTKTFCYASNSFNTQKTFSFVDGCYLQSNNKQYVAKLCSNGELRIDDIVNNTKIWSNNQAGSSDLVRPFIINLQPDRNLCIRSNLTKTFWCNQNSISSSNPLINSIFILLLDNDGKLKVQFNSTTYWST